MKYQNNLIRDIAIMVMVLKKILNKKTGRFLFIEN